MPRKRKPTRPTHSLRDALTPGLSVSQGSAEHIFGTDVSGVIRVDDFPTEPSSFIVQHQ